MILLTIYIILMFICFYCFRKLKIFDSWCNFDERAPCYTTMAILWPFGIIGGIFTYLFNITK